MNGFPFLSLFIDTIWKKFLNFSSLLNVYVRKKNKKNAIVKNIVVNFSDVYCAKSPNQRPAINSINLVPKRASRFPPLLEASPFPPCGMGIPFSYS